MKRAIMVPLQGASKISPFPPGDVEKCLQWFEENGFTGVEPVLATPKEVDVKQLRVLFEKYHLKTTTLVTGQADSGLSLCSDDDVVRKHTIERMAEYIEFAGELNCMVTVGLIKGAGKFGQIEDSLLKLTDSLNILVQRAEQAGVTLILEPINHTKAMFLNSSTEILNYIEKYYKSAPVKILWDSFQANIEDYHMIKILDDIKPYLGHVHFADSNRKLPGQGNIDFPSVYQKLYDIGYDGYITLECYNNPSGEYILDHAKEVFDSLESLVLSWDKWRKISVAEKKE